MDHPLQVPDRAPDPRAQEVAGHLQVVGLGDEGAVERHVTELDQSGSPRRLGRGRASNGGQFEPERDAAAESRNDASPRDLGRLTGDGRRQAHPDRRPVVDEADGGWVRQPPALVSAAVLRGEMAVSPIPGPAQPGAERRQQPDEQVEQQDDQTEDDQFHGSANPPFRSRPDIPGARPSDPTGPHRHRVSSGRPVQSTVSLAARATSHPSPEGRRRPVPIPRSAPHRRPGRRQSPAAARLPTASTGPLGPTESRA